MVDDDVDTTKQSPITRALLITNTSVTRYGVDLVLDSRIVYSDTPPMTVGSEERVGCVTA
jgi:hypothetical protein